MDANCCEKVLATPGFTILLSDDAPRSTPLRNQ